MLGQILKNSVSIECNKSEQDKVWKNFALSPSKKDGGMNPSTGENIFVCFLTTGIRTIASSSCLFINKPSVTDLPALLCGTCIFSMKAMNLSWICILYPGSRCMPLVWKPSQFFVIKGFWINTRCFLAN